jgi:hypothetical protein
MRIADDLLTTTGRGLIIDPVYDEEGWWRYGVDVDGVTGAFGFDPPSDTERFVAELADKLQEFVLDDWGGWPLCPRHNTHPLIAGVSNGIASWSCPRGGGFVARIGALGRRS